MFSNSSDLCVTLTSVTAMQGVQLQVEGQGLVPDMFRNISASLLEDETATEAPPEDLDPAACLPSPRQPDLNKYHQISKYFRQGHFNELDWKVHYSRTIMTQCE